MRIKRLQNPHATAPTAMPALPTPRFDLFYKHDELTQLLRAYAEALPELIELRPLGRRTTSLAGQSQNGPAELCHLPVTTQLHHGQSLLVRRQHMSGKRFGI